MRRATRREFIAASSTLAGAAAFGWPNRLFAQAKAAETAEAGGAAKMAIARWSEQGDAPAKLAYKLTEECFKAIGGMGRFVSKGDNVWVKPNIGWNRKPAYAANTHPDVVAALVDMCKQAGAKTVYVGDNTCNRADQCYESSGIADAAKRAGAEVRFLDKSRFRKMDIGGEKVKEHPVFPAIVECDLVISVPVCKHHGSTGVSLAMKNFMGVIEDRGAFHQDLPTTIADLTRFMKPQISVLDATRMLMAHGPVGGNLDDVKFGHAVAASTDIVALDAYGSELLGRKPADISTVTKGQAYELGTLDYKSLQPREVTV